MRTRTLTLDFDPVTRWFTGTHFMTLAQAYFLLSLGDLLATLRTVPTGILYEGNGAANAVLATTGVPGLILLKLVMVSLVLATLWYVSVRRPALASGILWGAVMLMGFVALYHLTIFAGLLV